MIKRISQKKFESYNYFKNPMLSSIATEQSWYSLDESNIIGTVLLDKIDLDWSSVIMAKESDGEYRFADGKTSISSESLAESELQAKMNSFASEGKINEELYESTLFDPKSARVITDMNNEIKSFFKKYPQKLYDINPRKFEELIASIMEDLGFNVELTQATKDGGRDIIASVKNAVTDFLAYIECKRYAEDNKIGVGIIRSVAGVHYLNKPSKSIIVTTSFFTKDAHLEAKQLENQLDLKDFNHIKEWLEKY